MLTALAVSIVFVAGTSDGGAGARDGPAIKHYVGRSRAACETIDYRCPAGAETFQDKDGCGCVVPGSSPAGQGDKGEVGR